MTAEKILAAVRAAEKFLKEANRHLILCEDYPGYSRGEWSKEVRAEVRRLSRDLTRALADLRRAG